MNVLNVDVGCGVEGDGLSEEIGGWWWFALFAAGHRRICQHVVLHDLNGLNVLKC